MTITPLDIYLISVADKVLCSVIPVATLSFGVFCVSCFLSVVVCETNEERRKGKLVAKTTGIVFVLSASLGLFVPSSKTIAAMYVLPAIVNNEHIQNATGNTLELLERLTKDWLKDTIKEQDIKQGEANI